MKYFLAITLSIFSTFSFNVKADEVASSLPTCEEGRVSWDSEDQAITLLSAKIMSLEVQKDILSAKVHNINAELKAKSIAGPKAQAILSETLAQNDELSDQVESLLNLIACIAAP